MPGGYGQSGQPGYAASSTPLPSMTVTGNAAAFGTPYPSGSAVPGTPYPQVVAQQPAVNTAPQGGAIQAVGDRTFVWRNEKWVDTTYDPDVMDEPVQLPFLSDIYFTLLEAQPRVAEYYALGEAVIFVLDGIAYEIVPQ
jgi:hypothetical protein